MVLAYSVKKLLTAGSMVLGRVSCGEGEQE
jgi:hypothetical protein